MPATTASGFELGFGGLLEVRLKSTGRVNPDKAAFLRRGESVASRRLSRFVDRHIAKIKEMIPNENRVPRLNENLETMLKTCETVRLDAPKTFQRGVSVDGVLSTVHRESIPVTERVSSLTDCLLPFYENDVKNGVLDDETAKFLIANLLAHRPPLLSDFGR